MKENRLIFVYIHLDQFPYLKITKRLKKTNECHLQTYCNGIESGHHNLCTTAEVRTQVICAQSNEEETRSLFSNRNSLEFNHRQQLVDDAMFEYNPEMFSTIPVESVSYQLLPRILDKSMVQVDGSSLLYILHSL